jgi:hypothetical protein
MYWICNEDEHRDTEECIEFCKEDPDRFGCKDS